MRHSALKTAAKTLAGGLLIPFCLCSPLTDDSLAGGSGAGNPGGAVAFSVCAVSQGGTQPPQVLGKLGVTLVDSARTITAFDKGGQAFKINIVSLNDVAVSFVLDTMEEPGRLLSSMKNRPPDVSSDTHSLVLDDPYRFDALQQTAPSPVPVMRLPVARYTGVHLDFGTGSSPQYAAAQGRIVIGGEFIYNGTTHSLSVEMSCSNLECSRYFPFSGGIFTLSADDTTHLQLQFNAQQWFSESDLAGSLSSGAISFDSTGTLTISSASNNPSIRALEETLDRDFIMSGRLIVY